MSDQSEYLYYRQLFDIFKAYTTPKLIRVLEEQGIKYMLDAKGKPFTTRSAIAGALEPENIVPSTAPAGQAEAAPSLG